MNEKKSIIGYVVAIISALVAVFFGIQGKTNFMVPFGLAAVMILMICLFLKNMGYNVMKKGKTENIAYTGLFAAIVLVGFFLSIKFPLMGTKAQIGFGNVFCVLSGLVLGPVYGGFAAGIGGCIYDLLTGWADSCLQTFITKLIMAFIVGLIAWGIKGNNKIKLSRIIVAAIVGSLSYCILYLGNGWLEATLLGNTEKALQTIMGTKAVITIINAVIADVIAIPLFMTLRVALKKSHLAFTN